MTEPSRQSKSDVSFTHTNRITRFILISLWLVPFLASVAAIYFTLTPRASPVRTLRGPTDRVESLAFSPDSKILASGSDDDTIRLWLVSDGQLLRTISQDSNVTSVAFSMDGGVLASSTDTLAVNLWSVSDGSLLHTLQNGENYLTSPVCGLTFSPDGKLLAAGSQNHSVVVWRLSDGMPVSSFQAVNGCDKNGTTFAFSSDSTTLATTVAGGEVDLWRVVDGSLVGRVQGDAYMLALSPDGSLLATGSVFDSIMKIWRIADGRLLRSFSGSGDNTEDLAFTPNSEILASASNDGTFQLWAVSDGHLIRTVRPAYGDWWNTLMYGSGISIRALAFSPDSKILATGLVNGKILLWPISY